jgi:hypothetical protein
MTYKVYIQSLNNFPIADWAVSAYLGFKGNGTDIIFFEDIEEVPASKWHIVIADIESTNSYLERLGIGPKMSLNIPECIEHYAGRKIWRMTHGEFKQKVLSGEMEFPLFVKPNGKSKEFIGGVLKDKRMYDSYISGMMEYVPMLISEPVEFISEYRGYVCEDKLIGLYWYSGDFRRFPKVEIIDAAIDEYTKCGAPIGYSIDFGITDKGDTLLVECNDGWSLGNYGLEPSKYCRLLGRRWHEMMKAF